MTETKKIKIYSRLLEGLKLQHSIYEEDLINYIYWGGDFGSHLSYYLFTLKEGIPLEKEERCPCGKDISNNCYIKHLDDDKKVIVGSCCIKNFLPNGLKRRCEVCNEPHKRRIINRCQMCEKIKNNSTDITEFFKKHEEKQTEEVLCSDCNKTISNKYKKCYSCYEKEKPNKCITCKKPVSTSYKKCYSCFKLS